MKEVFVSIAFVFQELLGLVYEEIEKPHVWNEDIQMVRALLELHFALCFFRLISGVISTADVKQ